MVIFAEFGGLHPVESTKTDADFSLNLQLTLSWRLEFSSIIIRICSKIITIKQRNKRKYNNNDHIMGLDGENKYFIFRDEDTSLRRTFKWDLWLASKETFHASCQKIWRRTCKTTRIFYPSLAHMFGGRGVSDGSKMANFYFGTVSLVLHLVWSCLNIYLVMKLLWKCHWRV